MRLGLLFRLYVLWGFMGVATSVTKAAKRKVAGRRSRQALEAEPVEGVWSTWGEWSECSQPCGVGVSHRSRKCLPPPPPPQAPPVSFAPPNWAGYLPAGAGGPVISSMRPYYPRYPGQPPPYHPPSVGNHNPAVSLYRNAAPAGGGGAPVLGRTNPSPPYYPADYNPANQDPPPVYRPPYRAPPPYGYNQPARVIRRPSSPAGVRPGGGGSRRSVSPGLESQSTRRSSPIRPGQFGYGRVPFSLPLHRANRQARHANATAAPVAADHDGEEAASREEEKEVTEAPAAKEKPTVAPRSHPRADHGRARQRPPSPHPFRRPHPPAVSRGTFDWHSVTAPPPPASSRLHQGSAAVASSPFAPPLHRPAHRDAELHPGFGRRAGGDFYPLEAQPGGGRSAPQNYKCSGAEKDFRRCFTQVCGRGAPDPRAEQCAAFDGKEFMDRLYSWEPFTEVGVDKQCELTCRPAGYRFYVRLAERVRDGTPCFNVSSNDVCVEGRCLTEGCDGVLGSDAVVDKCGVCGGGDTTCRKVTGSFRNTTVPLGYHKILDVPAGATFINITERRASPNYLAMRSGTGASVVNGRWAVDPPGEYRAGGTTFTYTRPRAQAEGEEGRGESLWARGPTTTQLQLYIIFHQQNPGIDYEFYVPAEEEEEEKKKKKKAAAGTAAAGGDREGMAGRASLRSPLTVSMEDPPPAPPPVSAPFSPALSSEGWAPDRPRPRGSAPNRNARIPPRTDLPLDTLPPFVWRRGSLSECSASCGKGYQTRAVLCVDRHSGEEVPDRKCDSAAKPTAEEEPCNTFPCPPFWEASSWSECSVSCGPGVQQRQLQCRQSFGNRSTMVHPQRCANLPPPESTQGCQLQLCSHWEVSSEWSSCSVDCGVGKRTRSVRCVSDQGSVVNDKECNSRLRPQGSEECNMGPCVTNWYFTNWSGACSAQCGPGVQRREVVCLTRGGVREGGAGGDCVGEKPAEMKACNGGPCETFSTWYSSPWTQCNVPCGNGTQRRDVICIQKTGGDVAVAPVGECAHLDRPAAVQQCEMGECRPRWFTTEWSACSRSCGRGLQMREVRCLTPDRSHSHDCDLDNKPEQEQICNTVPCSPQVPDENCRDRRHNCVMVVQARLCVYSYYKTACCASCTQSAQRAKRH